MTVKVTAPIPRIPSAGTLMAWDKTAGVAEGVELAEAIAE
jgi:hypothetical protein